MLMVMSEMLFDACASIASCHTSPRQAPSEPDLPLVLRGAEHLHEVRRVHIAAWGGEWRRVSRVEGFGPELQCEALGQRESAKHAEVQIDYAGPSQNIAPRRAEPDGVHGGEGLGIEKVLARSDASQVFDRGLDLVRRLAV